MRYLRKTLVFIGLILVYAVILMTVDTFINFSSWIFTPMALVGGIGCVALTDKIVKS